MTPSLDPADLDLGLAARLDRIEARLDRLVAVLDQAAPAIAMAADSADEIVERATERGLDVDARTRSALRFLEDLTEPDTLARLGEVVRQLNRLEPAILLATRLDETVAMAADVFDAWATQQVERGADLDAGAHASLRLLQGLAEPRTAEAATRMLRRLPELEPLVALAATFEPTTAMLCDLVDAHVRSLQDRGIDIEARIRQVVSLVERLTDPAFQRHVETLLDATPALAAAMQGGQLLGSAVGEVSTRPAPPMGLWAMVRSLSDPQVQRAAGFAVAVARNLGGRLPRSSSST